MNRASLAVAAIVLLSAASAASAQASGGLVPGGETPDVLLLHTGDVVGYIEPCG